ncbi:TAXI family TRAP transporter solute-binding subunit [Salinicola avicenniae]|uniref:TAXI family TRAP transporter solute-binding subunit n=1 Tax=Salinicola avicenniae TaxID=2916836 RepID=UPI002073295B|nr:MULTISPECIES: TAXI family TRAP transporter solute-binding subunit [unclassified Salinicola]
MPHAKSLSAHLLGAIAVWIASVSDAHAGEALRLGTGGAAGVYLPEGRAICQRYQETTGKACQALSTGGSIYNAQGVRTGDLDVGIVQSDIQYAALRGEGEFYDSGPSPELRSLFSLHAEAFTVVATPPNIQRFDDLAGHRVNVGNPGSGHRATLSALLDIRGETEGIYDVAAELRPADMTSVMCDGRLDAFFYVVGHPSQAIDEATRRCNAHLVEVAGADVDALLTRAPFYSLTSIPGGTYANTPEDTATFGVRATLITRADVDAQQIYDLVAAVFDHLDTFRQAHPSLSTLSPEAMVTAGLTAPLHPGARRYYEEKGLLPATGQAGK